MLVWNEFLNDARVLKEAQTLQSEGHQVCVHALHTPGVTQQKERREEGISVTRVARSPFWGLRKKRRKESEKSQPVEPKPITLSHQLMRLVARSWTHSALCHALIKSKPDVIHAHDVNVLPTAWLASILCRVPLVYDAHEISTSREGYKSFRKLVAWIKIRMLPKAVAVITTTDMRAKYLARAYGVKESVVLQNRPRLTTAEKSSDCIREHLSLPERDWPIVLYQGGLQSGRGLEKLIDAARLVENVYFVLIGGGRLTYELNCQISSLNLESRVHIIPTVPLSQLPRYTASADLGIQPIDNTCFNHFSTDSNKLFEYALAGLPVLASNFPEIRKIVQKYSIGDLIQSNTPEGLAAQVKQLVFDHERLERYRRNALLARDNLCWEEQEHKLTAIYQSILVPQ
ncbi:glycosyltransferase [Vibrio sp. HN007]|uniref:glycosyltransferase n=1 Tax=Vibrio iocasae TaxID=3098914 RepID=UPI0035D4074C